MTNPLALIATFYMFTGFSILVLNLAQINMSADFAIREMEDEREEPFTDRGREQARYILLCLVVVLWPLILLDRK